MLVGLRIRILGCSMLMGMVCLDAVRVKQVIGFVESRDPNRMRFELVDGLVAAVLFS